MAAERKQDLSLEEADPEVFDLLEHEKARQWKGLELIASENFTSRAVMEALGSHFTNKYSEGLPGARYYGGNEYIDELERLCIQRALAAFHLDEKEWGVNVQPYSGSPANFAAFTALLRPHDRFMGLDLPSGGHLTHGFYRGQKRISASSIYFENLPYSVSTQTGLVDYDKLEEQALIYSPAMIVCGGSAYARDWDYARLRRIADAVGALLLCDMAHFSGLVAAEVLGNPFQYCDVVTTTTHKTLRGPRAGMIFFKKDQRDLGTRINNAVFPACQGGPHNNAIAALAVQLKEVASEEWKEYAHQVVANARALAATLTEKGMSLVTGGTDNHLILWDLRPFGLTGSKLEALCDQCSITLNKNSVYGDKSALSPGGVRVGTPALTSRGFKEQDFRVVGEFLVRAANIALQIQNERNLTKLNDFKAALKDNADIAALKADVEAFAKQFYMPNVDPAKLRYRD
eukprot:TRINITY_DN512_c0_g2_i4.p1 TRINITY_DN512_c0_g2~~TRINITY_DN512_c0_g2_i4.p1  ORF type:complete len:459 (+),score=225.76 TRINITY_DN512_c0_g2_i4:52-1428(+)